MNYFPCHCCLTFHAQPIDNHSPPPPLSALTQHQRRGGRSIPHWLLCGSIERRGNTVMDNPGGAGLKPGRDTPSRQCTHLLTQTQWAHCDAHTAVGNHWSGFLASSAARLFHEWGLAHVLWVVWKSFFFLNAFRIVTFDLWGGLWVR